MRVIHSAVLYYPIVNVTRGIIVNIRHRAFQTRGNNKKMTKGSIENWGRLGDINFFSLDFSKLPAFKERNKCNALNDRVRFKMSHIYCMQPEIRSKWQRILESPGSGFYLHAKFLQTNKPEFKGSPNKVTLRRQLTDLASRNERNVRLNTIVQAREKQRERKRGTEKEREILKADSKCHRTDIFLSSTEPIARHMC